MQPFYGTGLTIGTVFIPSPMRAWDNMIGGIRFYYGIEIPLRNGGVLFFDASIGAILHFVFGDSANGPYGTMIDSFSGFGIEAGYRF